MGGSTDASHEDAATGHTESTEHTGSAAAAKEASSRRPARRLFKRLSAALPAILAGVLLFALGNISGSLGVVDVGNFVGLSSSQTRGSSSADTEVASAQLAARLDEVAALLDGDALYRYTQGDIDTATTEAIRALIETSDDSYAYYYTAEEYAEYLRDSEGEYPGIGIVLAAIDGKITVLQVYEGSPAFEAGVVAGDVLLAVDGDRHDWELEEAIDAIRRESGQEVTILWQRGDEERETVLALRDVSIPTIVSHLIEQENQTVGYIYLRRFNAQSAEALGEALRGLEAEGAASFILDLRGNPGGYLGQALDITSLFVAEGAVVQIEDRRGTTVEKVNGTPITNRPLVVLVDGGSASAAELVAAALRDHNRATLVGEKTYGKGTVQDIRELSWGGVLKYTVAHYLSPAGTVLDGVGITPDVVVESAAEPESIGASDRPTAGDYRYRPGVDPQLDAALAAALTAALDS
ncbi:MAG: PDZ domain-containing protein [Coriobacteriales bacterium]|jgi:carboxyl-terminal processing protease|nr:PDZ domain-containing protein [Coriobacteriales bacterium]